MRMIELSKKRRLSVFSEKFILANELNSNYLENLLFYKGNSPSLIHSFLFFSSI